MAPAVRLAVILLLRSAHGAPSTCPALEAVQAALLPSTAKSLRENREQVVLATSKATLLVQVASESGAPLLERTLATTAPCSARAAAAATLVEAMELELHGGPPRLELPAMEVESPAATANADAMTARGAVNVEVGIALLGSLSQATLEPAAGLTVDVVPRWAGLSLRAELFAEGRRSLAIGAGRVSYQNSWLAVGPGYRLRWSRFSIEAGLSLTGTLQELRGDGITSATSLATVEAGASLEASAGWSFASWRIWGGFFALYWPANTTVAIIALGETRTLPAWEGLLGAGLQFTRL